MNGPRCLYALIHAPQERLEDLLCDGLGALVGDLRGAPGLDSLFFVRYSDPRWQLRFRVFGEPAWVEGSVRTALEGRLAALEREGTVEDFSFTRYERELERYGGERGMALAERLFGLDSLAVFDLIVADRAGQVARSRREIALLLADGLVDLAGFDHDARLAFYRRGYAWAEPEWDQADRGALEERFRALRPGLEGLFDPASPAMPPQRWGGGRPAGIAARFLEQARPVLAEIVAGVQSGEIRQDPVYLLWSYAHMLTNRLGVESAGEAVLRFLMARLVEERSPAA